MRRNARIRMKLLPCCKFALEQLFSGAGAAKHDINQQPRRNPKERRAIFAEK
jgi:hypothetical protein